MTETRGRITANVNQVEARVREQVHQTLRSGPTLARQLPAALGLLRLFNRAGFRYGMVAGAAAGFLAIRQSRPRR